MLWNLTSILGLDLETTSKSVESYVYGNDNILLFLFYCPTLATQCIIPLFEIPGWIKEYESQLINQ